MTTTKKFRYIIGTSVGYLQDLIGKNMANMTERRLAFTFDRCDDAKAQKEILINNKYEDVRIEKVYCIIMRENGSMMDLSWERSTTTMR